LKPIRNIVILVAVIAVLIGGFYFITVYEPQPDETPAPSVAPTVNMFKVEKDSILSVTVHNEEESYSVDRSGESWLVNHNPAIKINQSRLETFLYECASITARELLAENVQDFSQYGLSSPARSVDIEMKDGTMHTILVGNLSVDGSVRYIMVAGETKVYTKSASGCDSLTASLQKLLETDIYSMEAEEVGSIHIQKTGAEEILLVYAEVGKNDAGEALYEWQMKAPLIKTANSYTISEELLTNIVSQTAQKVIPAGTASATAYGFDSPRARYTLTSVDGTESYSVTVGRQEGSSTYIQLVGDEAVYQVETAKLDFLEPGYLDFVDKLIHIENIDDVKRIVISGSGRDYTLTIDGQGDAAGFKINDKKIEGDSFRKAYQAVIGLTLDGFMTEPFASNATDYTITYERTDGTRVVVSCIPYNDRNYLVQVDGEGNLLMRKKQMDAMFAMLDKTIA